MTPEERSAPENGIWLCQTCSRLIDVDVPSYRADLLREWKTLAEMRAYLGLRGFAIVVSRSFDKLEEKMPDLIAEMRKDIADFPFSRTCVAMSSKAAFNGDPDNPTLIYYTDKYEHLVSKMKVMENYAALVDVTTKVHTPKFELTEDFVEYLQLPR
ncbi:hypothetical protein [Mameliella sediminis]|uniref:hypothetical protein n=1 Tax=Mameliella sediminis TaxID=2836866 RepID=UPI001C479061|nr:hypothetical protein [Mameliella sediminis]MBV7393253.1 hypothetical protein [Mameliella sediminis]